MTWEEITNRPMTREEAIKQLREFIILHQEQHGWDISTIKALEMAIKALERNIPMKVNVEKWIHTKCPSGCGYELSTHHKDGYYSIDNKPTFCPNCGQALLWAESEEV